MSATPALNYQTDTILVIDDAPANLSLMVNHLESAGFNVVVAQDGEEGIKRAKFVQPDLVLLDVIMPGIDGFETCRLLKADEKTRGIPVIFMTSLPQIESKVAGFGAGAVDYVTKPLQAEEVLARVKTHLDLHKMKKQLEAQNLQLQQEIAERKQVEEELRRYKDHLEEMVIERTAELLRANEKLQEEINERELAEAALRDSEQRFAIAFNSSPYALTISTLEDGRYIAVNDTCLRVSGYTREEMLGRTVLELNGWVDPQDRADFIRLVREQGVAHDFEARLRKKSGEVRTFSLSVAIIEIDGEQCLLTAADDITERKQAQEELQRRADEFAALYETARDLATQQDIAKLLDTVIERAMALLGVSSAGILFYDPARDDLELVVSKGNQVPVGTRVAMNEGMLGKVVESRQPIIVDDYRTWPGRSPRFEAIGVKAIMEVPMFFGGELIGVIGVAEFETARKFTESDARLLSLFAAQAASAVRNARLLTETRMRAEQLAASEERYRALYDDTPSMYFTVASDGTVLSVNKFGAAYLGYTVEELVGQSVLKVFEVADQSDAERHVTECIDNPERVFHWEIRKVRKDQSIVWVKETAQAVSRDGQVVALIVCEDITERKKAEEALRKSEEEHRLFFELDLAANYVCTPEGYILNCNPAFARLFGYASIEEVIERSPLYSKENAREEFLDLLRKQGRIEYYEEELRRKDGSVVHVIENAIGTFDENGKLIEVRGFLIDDTERRKVEQQLRQSQKLEAIGSLAGGVAHDFNNLLTAILGYSEILLRKVPRPDPMYGEVLEIKLAGERAATLTRQLLAFSRKQILKPKVLNLNEIVTSMDKMLRRLIGEDIYLVSITDPALGFVKADPGQIEQVIMNLAVNARDAMPQGGRLTVETANVYLDEDFAARHLGVKPDHYVMLAVSDNGCGMDEEVLSHVFDPFFTTKEAGKGTGLGLSTVYGIIRQSGGSVWVYSEKGHGTTFKIYLPRVDEAPDSSITVARIDSVPKGSETVLLVEDELLVRRLAVSVLQEVGYTVLEASNGEEALRIATDTNNLNIDLLVTDVVMPQMGGKELAERVKTILPHIKMLFISGYTDSAIVKHGYLDEDVTLLQKPFTPSDLAKRVREVLDGTDKNTSRPPE